MRAKLARDIWTINCKISIDSPDNIVTLPKMIHKPLHTSIYYNSINSSVYWAYEFGGCTAVKSTVKAIGKELQGFGDLLP